MIVFVTLWVFAFYCCPAFVFLASKTLIFEPLLFNILNPFDANNAIFLLEVTLRNPNGANVMNPNIMAAWYGRGVSRLNKIVIVAFFFFLAFFSYYFYCSFLILFNFIFLFANILLFLLIVRAFFRVLVVPRVKLFDDVRINVNRCSFHCSSFNIAERAR